MSVPVQVPISGPYTANGSTTQFGYQFYLLLESDLDVFVGGAKKILNTDYTVTGVGNSAGGNVVFKVAPASGLEVIIKRNTPFTRTTDYADNGDLLADVVNDDFDRLWLALQEINANFGSSISRPVGGNWTAQNLRLTMLADGTQPQDAVTYKQLFTVNGNAAAAAEAAAQSASAAATSQQAAATSAGNAATSETNSSDSAALARRWAAETPDIIVADNLYSARHYASKAVTSASNAAASESTASTAATNATNAAGTANTAATTATTQADRAKTEADKLGNMNALAAAINSVDSQNNVTWKSKLTLGIVAVNGMDAATLSQVNDAKSDAKSAVNTFSSIIGAASAPASGVVVYGGDLASKYQVNGADWATARLRVKATGGTTPLRQVAIGLDEAGAAKEWLMPSEIGSISVVVDSGSNANGRYIKYADGTLICYHALTDISVTSTVRSEGSFSGYLAGYTWNYPSAFANTSLPSVNASVRGRVSTTNQSATMITTTIDASSNINAAGINTFSSLAIDRYTSVTLFAIGRWK